MNLKEKIRAHRASSEATRLFLTNNKSNINQSANFFARPSSRPFPFLLDSDLRETFFRSPHSCVLFFGRLQYRPSWTGRPIPGLLEMNLQAPLGCLHPDPAMLAIDCALNDDVLDNDLHREIAAAAKWTISLALKFSPLAVIKMSTTAPKLFTRSSPLVSLVPVILHSLRTILICNVVPRPPPWIAISQWGRCCWPRAHLAELTTFTLLSLDFLLLSFCYV